MKIYKYIIFFAVFICSCAEKHKVDQASLSQRMNDDNGEYYYFTTRSKQTFLIRCDSFGNIKLIGNHVKGYLQQVSFFSNGNIMSKVKVDYDSAKKFDRAYYFYEESGNLDTDYQYENGVKTGYAAQYYDSTCDIFKKLLFCERGKVHQTEIFDKEGHLVSKEGCTDLKHTHK